jgi:hypothetical protein
MDKYLSEKESQLQGLLHSKSFSELNVAELKFVLKETTELDYVLQRKVIEEAVTIFDDDEVVAPLPLAVPQNAKGVSFGYMPIYQSLLLVAATIIFMLLIFPIHTENGTFKTRTEYIVKTDTVEIEKEIYKYDTIYKTVEKPVYIKQDVFVESNSNPCVSPIQEAPRLLQSNSSINLPDLTVQLTMNKGTSLKDDGLSSLIVEF